jgi:hypothetical protein
MARRQKNAQQQEYSPEDVPSYRVKHGLRHVSPPFQTIRLSHLLYILVILTGLLAAYYSYRIVQYKNQVGGWWDVALGRPAQAKNVPVQQSMHHRTSVEDKINDLARALGMPSKELASAIAVAVKNYVPPASLSSVAAEESGPAVQALLKESRTPAAPSVTDVVGRVTEGIGKFVGMDEP